MLSLITQQQCIWHSFKTIDELEQEAVRAILHAASQAISQRGTFHLVLAGGNTPRSIYTSLRAADTDWTAWNIYYGDERCLPPEHADRNSLMAWQAWLNHVAIPANQIHPIPAELGAEKAADSYSKIIEGIAQFDLVLLGLGEDGHTASLFPNHDWGATPGSANIIAVHGAPKPPADRVSLSAKRLSAASQVMFLVTGNTKLQAVNDWLKGENIPAAAISPASGVEVYIEAALLNPGK
jgi:6-phosphogluconolactonase